MNPGRRRLVFGGTAAVAGLAGAGLAWWRLRPHDVADGAEAALWGLKFDTPTGSQLAMAPLRGRPLLVNFWATSCTTCVKEMPNMIQTYNKYKGEGLEYVAVAMNYDAPMYVMNFSQTRQLPFKVALDNTGDIAKQWGDVKLTPTTYLVDKQGRIVKRYVGEPDFPALHKLIEELLAQQA